jgi:uncharacterized lipoprotein YmbA
MIMSMKYMITFLIILSACAKPQAASQSSSNDPLRASMQWQASEPWWATDFNPNASGLVLIHWVGAFDEECESAADMSNGTMTVALSTEISSTQGSDVTCSQYDGSWTYSVNATGQLVLCQSGQSCVTFN